MDFATPWALALVAVAIPLAILAWWRRRPVHVLASAAALVSLRPTVRLRLLRLLPIARLVAVALLAVALAGPRSGKANAVVPGQGIDIALALDVSSSMVGAPFGTGGGDRLEVAKDVIREFIKGRENDRIGFVVFQQDALALSPPTLDYAALDRIVNLTQSGILPDGTGIGVGLATALNMLRESNAASRIVILLTDGEHNAVSISPEEAAKLAEALHIRVYIIGLLGEPGAGRSGADAPRMEAIAEGTGGGFYSAGNPAALASVYDEIRQLETSRVGRERFDRYTEYAPWFAAGAAVLVFAELLLRATWLRRTP